MHVQEIIVKKSSVQFPNPFLRALLINFVFVMYNNLEKFNSVFITYSELHVMFICLASFLLKMFCWYAISKSCRNLKTTGS